MAARRSSIFHNVIRKADLLVIDGSGPLFVAWLLGLRELPARVTGTDIIVFAMDEAQSHALRVFLFGGESGEGEKAALVLSERYPDSIIEAWPSGKIRRDDDGWHGHDEAFVACKAFAPQIVFVALGHEKQERFIDEIVSQVPSVRLAVGVGGVFTLLSGRVKPSPVWLRLLGFEWLWRGLKVPLRW